MLAAEVDERAERRRGRRVTEARFPRIKRLGDFDVTANPGVNAETVSLLASCAYLDRGEPVVLLGRLGTGKSHLLIGMGLAACELGKRVRYVTCAGLVNELVEAQDERRLARLVARYGRLDLLLVDELGYVQLDTRGAELLFQILTEREEKASVAIGSNLPFSEWGQVVTDPRLVAAIVDRVTFNGHIIETGTESFRLADHGQAGEAKGVTQRTFCISALVLAKSNSAGSKHAGPLDRRRALRARDLNRFEELGVTPCAADVFRRTGVLAVEADAELQDHRHGIH